MIPLLLLACVQAEPAAAQVVHSVCDLSQSFTFYLDGRFAKQYLDGRGHDARNWGSLEKLDLANVNLLVLEGGDPRLPYAPAAIERVAEFAHGGGAVLLMADGGDPMPPGAALAARFGARLTERRAEPPLACALADGPIEFHGGRRLEAGADWIVLARDAGGAPVLVRRDWGAGTILLASRGLFGRQPDASDPLNAAWITPLLLECAARKPVDPRRPPRAQWAELTKEIGPLTLEFHLGTAPFAERIAAEYLAIRPQLVAITGVEPAPGMIQRLLILPTGDGGYSSGERIAIGAWWGGYPERRYPMVELIGHEAGHSWVLPHAEPLWNEPIATWLGVEAGRRLGLADEAQSVVERQIAAARALDPGLDALDPLAPDAPRDLVWGKSFHVFEELERLHGPGAMAKYFRAKRALVASDRASYTMDDCVAVWSAAVGADLFPWFRGLGFSVDPARTGLRARDE